MATPVDSAEQELKQLRDRLTEWQEGNAHLRHLEDTIRKNERLFERLLLRSREGIVLVSPDLIILRLIHSSLGFQELEVSGQPLAPFLRPDDVATFMKSFTEVASARVKSASCKFRAGNKNGTWTWLRCDTKESPGEKRLPGFGRFGSARMEGASRFN
ncbi:MAG TPA: PAS domain-containing protein [Bryobacteraceae bacterium]|nr:PAS domain-containing protein [Bryobacteraceae bacterium]